MDFVDFNQEHMNSKFGNKLYIRQARARICKRIILASICPKKSYQNPMNSKIDKSHKNIFESKENNKSRSRRRRTIFYIFDTWITSIFSVTRHL